MKIRILIKKRFIICASLLASVGALLLPIMSVQAVTITNGMAASYVFGQADFVSNSSGGTASTLQGPGGILFDGVNNRLYVADYDNFRVLVFDVSSLSTGQAAVNVLGQPDLTTVSYVSAGTSTLGGPNGLALDSTGNRLFVSQKLSSRISVFDVSTITNGENAINVLGQNDFTSSSANRGGSAGQGSLNAPEGLAYDAENDLLYVADFLNHRVQIFDVAEITNGESSINVLGQPDFTSTDSDPTIDGLSNPTDVALDSEGERLFIASGHNRVTVYDVATITDGEAAINVLGQPDFTSNSIAVSQTGMNIPYGITFDSVLNYLYVVDGTANRVLVYDVATITDGEAAINVLGQPDFTSNDVNYGGAEIPNGKGGFSYGPSVKGFSSPKNLAYDSEGRLLYVSDFANNRVLIFDLSSTPTPSSGGSLKYIHPPTCTATFTPSTITKGQPTTLSWNTQWPSEKTSTYYTKVPTQGLYSSKVQSLTLEPQHTTDYTIAIFNLWGANFCTTTITVLDEEGQEITTNPNNSQLTAGVSNSPIVRAITAFFSRLFVR